MEPGSSPDIAGFIIIVICIFMSALFSASETAITALGQLKAQHLIEKRRERFNKHLNLWLKHPSRILTTILLFNNVFNIAASAEATILATHYFKSQAVGIATGIITFLVLIFGEIIPKSFARAHFHRLAPMALIFIYGLYLAFYPLVYLLSVFADFAVRLLGSQGINRPSITEEELEFLISEGEKAGVIQNTKREMLSGVFDFDETKAREIMTPRTDLVALPSDADFNTALNLIIESGHSRIPVYEERIDNIVGILFAKDILRHWERHHEMLPEITDFMREPLFLPESNLIMEVFKELQRTKNHLAVIIDEYGGTAGIVTMEDVLEEIVGDIQDEFDSEEAMFIELEPGVFAVSGSVNISDFVEYFGLDERFETEVEGEVDTIAGWMTKLLGDLPEVGQTVTQGPLTIEVEEVDRHRIEKLKVIRRHEDLKPIEA